MKWKILISALGVSLALAATPAMATDWPVAGDEFLRVADGPFGDLRSGFRPSNRDRDSREISLSDAVRTVKRAFPNATYLNAWAQGNTIYRVRMRAGDGRVFDVDVDRKSGRIVRGG